MAKARKGVKGSPPGIRGHEEAPSAIYVFGIIAIMGIVAWYLLT